MVDNIAARLRTSKNYIASAPRKFEPMNRQVVMGNTKNSPLDIKSKLVLKPFVVADSGVGDISRRNGNSVGKRVYLNDGNALKFKLRHSRLVKQKPDKRVQVLIVNSVVPAARTARKQQKYRAQKNYFFHQNISFNDFGLALLIHPLIIQHNQPVAFRPDNDSVIRGESRLLCDYYTTKKRKKRKEKIFRVHFNASLTNSMFVLVSSARKAASAPETSATL
jgi:hypothetical protein